MEIVFEKIEKYLIIALVFLLPITVLPISVNPFIIPKLVILAIGVGLLLLVFAVKVIVLGKLNWSSGAFDIPVGLLILSFVLSTVLKTPNKMEALLLPGTTTIVVGAGLFYFLINQLKNKEALLSAFWTSALAFAVISLLAFFGVLKQIPQLGITSNNFTPEGGFLPSAIFLASALIIGVGLFLYEKRTSFKAFWGASLAIVVLGLAVSIYNLLPGKPFSPRFPSHVTSWAIAVDSLKESPFLGVGPGNYLSAFNRFRPLTYNQSDLWALRFSTASNFYFTLLTEAGMLGTAAVILLLLVLYKSIRLIIKERTLITDFASASSLISLTLIVILFAVFPATTLLIFTFFVLLAITTKTKTTSVNLTTESEGIEITSKVTSKIPALLVSTPIIVLVIYFCFQGERIIEAEYKFKKALDALSRNQATQTYDIMREAININPRVDRYRATFARVNLALANSIATRAVTPSATTAPQAQPQVSEQDRQNITLLVQQAINEGKATVALNPLRSGNWELLAQVYRAVMPLAQGADTFAVQTYTQAIALDPINPILRIALGGIHYAKGDFEAAIRAFELASAAKPDFANAHYNLAFALRDDKKLDRAISEMTLVLSLLERTSPDYETARQALEDMQAKKKAEAATGTELTGPQPAEEVLKPPLELPEGSEPPQAPLSPTPTPVVGEEEQGSFNLSPTPSPQP